MKHGNLWEQFNPVKYVSSNYRRIHDEDRQILKLLVHLYERNLTPGRRCLDVGTGPNLYPIILLLPYALFIDCLEFSKRNVTFLNDSIHTPQAHWYSFLRSMKAKCANYSFNLKEELTNKVRIHKGSIIDNKKGGYDVVSMFFCAESITNNSAEFVRVCNKFVQAARSGGALVAAFMERSSGYRIGKIDFPAYPVDAILLKLVFGPLCNKLKIHHIKKAKDPLRDGYTGMLLLTGIKK